MRIHTRTAKNTTLHHPSVHSDSDTDPKHNKSRHFRTHLDQSRNCLHLLPRVCGCALLNLLLVNKGVGRGSSWSSLDLKTLESDVPSGKSVGASAKDRGWPSNSVLQRVAAIKRGDPSPRCVGGIFRRFTPELSDVMREFIEERGRISVRTVAIRFTLSRILQSKGSPFAALTFIGDPHSAPLAGPSHP